VEIHKSSSKFQGGVQMARNFRFFLLVSVAILLCSCAVPGYYGPGYYQGPAYGVPAYPATQMGSVYPAPQAIAPAAYPIQPPPIYTVEPPKKKKQPARKARVTTSIEVNGVPESPGYAYAETGKDGVPTYKRIMP
jgi:hypothetical protein